MEPDPQPTDPKTEPSELCRICLGILQGQESINIFSITFGPNKLSLHKMLQIVCTPVFSKNSVRAPEMPSAVCLLCKKRIVAAFQLHEKCIESDRKLWEMIAVKQEVVQETDDVADPLTEVNLEVEPDVKIKIETLPEVLSEQEDAQGDESDGSDYSEEVKKRGSGKVRKSLGNVCKFCSNDIRGNMMKHILREHKDKTFSCDSCDQSFLEAEQLEDHKLFHSTGLAFSCDICQARFRTKAQRKYHIDGHTAGGTTKCHFCEKNFAQEKSLAVHLKRHSPKTDFACPHCPLQFHSRQWRETHVLLKHEEHTVKPKRVNSWTPELKKARLLSMNAAYRKKRTCKICFKMLGNTTLLNQHISTKHKEAVLRCDSCEKVFLDQALLDDHKLFHSTGLEFGCSFCKERFDTKYGLRYHSQLHAGPFACNICDREFQRKGSWMLHMKRHSGVKPYACGLCPMRHYTKGEKEQHMLCHTKEQNHVCDICGSRFTKQDSLIKHVTRVHTDVRPFPCNQCDLKFATSGHLNRHARTHTGEKPYVCAYCSRAYAQSNDLLKHCRQHVGDRPYSCDRCDESFRLMSELRDHYKFHVQAGEVGEGPDSELRFTIMEVLTKRFEREKQRGLIKEQEKMDTSE